MRPYGAAWLQFFLQSLDLDQRLLRLELLGLGLGQMQGQDAVLKLSADVLGLQLLADIEAACAAAGSTLLADIESAPKESLP